MYSKQEASAIRKKFWTTFGQYMKPIAGTDGSTTNWLNYKTGIRHIYFRMDAAKSIASVSIELTNADEERRKNYFEKLKQFKALLEDSTGEEWSWEMNYTDEDGNSISRVFISLTGINIFNEADWPTIISFLKPRIIALDEFWFTAKDFFNDL